MGLVIFAAVVAPRVVLGVMWYSGNRVDDAFNGWFVPLLGLIFLPYATIMYVDENTLLDFVGGVGVLNVGHNHPRVLEAIREQSERFLHTDYTVLPYEGYVELAERLAAIAPISGDLRCAFFNSGAEAVEN